MSYNRLLDNWYYLQPPIDAYFNWDREQLLEVDRLLVWCSTILGPCARTSASGRWFIFGERYNTFRSEWIQDKIKFYSNGPWRSPGDNTEYVDIISGFAGIAFADQEDLLAAQLIYPNSRSKKFNLSNIDEYTVNSTAYEYLQYPLFYLF